MNKQMDKKIQRREYRFFSDFGLVEKENEIGGKKEFVRGYATTLNTPYVLYEDDELVIKEVMRDSAFNETDLSDVIMQYNHEGRVFARVKNNTLGLSIDNVGLAIEADLDGTEIGRQLKQEIRGGYTDKMSIGFGNVVSEWKTEELQGKQIETREIISIGKLYDVSAVSIPANDYTSISVRNLADGVLERLQAERLVRQAEIRNEKLKRLTIELLIQGVK